MDDFLQLRTWVFDGLESIMNSLLEGTALESSAVNIAFFIATLITSLTGFALIMLSMFMILWLERKVLGRLMDRRGAMTSLRSLWVGENGVTAGEWWRKLPFGLGSPVGALVGWLNKTAGNRDPKHPTVDRVNNLSLIHI